MTLSVTFLLTPSLTCVQACGSDIHPASRQTYNRRFLCSRSILTQLITYIAIFDPDKQFNLTLFRAFILAFYLAFYVTLVSRILSSKLSGYFAILSDILFVALYQIWRPRLRSDIEIWRPQLRAGSPNEIFSSRLVLQCALRSGARG